MHMNHQKIFRSLTVTGAEIGGGVNMTPPPSIKVGIGPRSVRVKSTVNAKKNFVIRIY